MTVLDKGPRSVEDVLADLKEHVWTLVKADHIDAAVVLLQASVDDFLAAQAKQESDLEMLAGELADELDYALTELHVEAGSGCRDLVVWSPPVQRGPEDDPETVEVSDEDEVLDPEEEAALLGVVMRGTIPDLFLPAVQLASSK